MQTKPKNAKYNTNNTLFAAMFQWPTAGVFGLEWEVCVYGFNFSCSVSMLVLPRALFSSNEIY